MTQEEMEAIANLIADKLWEKQMQLETESEETENKIGEMSKLETMLSIYEQSEQYKKAYEVKMRLDKIKRELTEAGVLKDDSKNQL